jgi:hypothetical protein
MASSRRLKSNAMRRCPACDERLPMGAPICRYCGTALDADVDPRGEGDPFEKIRQTQGDPDHRDSGCRAGRGPSDQPFLKKTEDLAPEPEERESAMPSPSWTDADFAKLVAVEKPTRPEPMRAEAAVEEPYEPWLDSSPAPAGEPAGRRGRLGSLHVALGALALVMVGTVLLVGPDRLRSAAVDLVQNAVKDTGPGSGGPTSGKLAALAGPSGPVGGGLNTTRPVPDAGGNSAVSPVPPGSRTGLVPPAPALPGASVPTPTTISPLASAEPQPSLAGNRNLAVQPTEQRRRSTTTSDSADSRRNAASPNTEHGRGITATGELVRHAQILLARLGYYRHRIDGLAGPQTRQAVRKFQLDAGLRPTGHMSPTLLRTLEREVGRKRVERHRSSRSSG